MLNWRFAFYNKLAIMDASIAALISEARIWLSEQPEAKAHSQRWFALGNMKTFISALESAKSSKEVEKAVWAMSRFISDQYEWSDDYCKVISSYLTRARRIGKDMENG